VNTEGGGSRIEDGGYLPFHFPFVICHFQLRERGRLLVRGQMENDKWKMTNGK
jgi:hypothetical protein